LLRAPDDQPTTAERRVLDRADAVLQYQPTAGSGTDQLVVRRGSGASPASDELPLALELRITDAIERNPDDSFN